MRVLDQANYKLTGHSEEPLEIDYNIFGLHKKKTIVQGELQSIEYYKSYDGVTYSDLVVDEQRVYTRDAWGLVLYRTQTSTWYLEDNSVGCTKVVIKYYNPQETMEEFTMRMSNLMSEAKLYVASQVGLPDALDFMTSLNTEISLYIQGEHTALLNAITASTKPYLTPTIISDLTTILTF